MLKYILLVSINLSLITVVKCETPDTTIFYIKNDINGAHRVKSLDSADFLRIIYPPDPDDSLLNIKEFYKNGALRLNGKIDPQRKIDYQTGNVFLYGVCVSYFPNGKKRQIANYMDGRKNGFEYFFYLNGPIYIIKKYVVENQTYRPKILCWECYDSSGVQICKEGNGHWIVYDDAFTHIEEEGEIKDGLAQGEWRGTSFQYDSIKYTYRLEGGRFISGIGYDKTGAGYPFKNRTQSPDYKAGTIFFIDKLRSKIKSPRDINGKKMNIDSVVVSFVVEKDGSITNPEVFGNPDADFKAAIQEILLKWKGWNPRRHYGIPVRTKITLPIKSIDGLKGPLYVRQLKLKEEDLGL